MSRLIIIFDPTDRVTMGEPVPPEIKLAHLSLPDDLGGADIYAVAKKLAELLLEQLS